MGLLRENLQIEHENQDLEQKYTQVYWVKNTHNHTHNSDQKLEKGSIQGTQEFQGL